MKTIVIANPRAKAGEVGRAWSRYKKAIEASFSIDHVQMTERPGHAKFLARKALQDGADQIIAVGGDGTFNEVVNGLADPVTGTFPGDSAKLVLLPCGTGSDFSRSIDMPRLSPRTALDRCTYRLVDVGSVELKGPNNETVTHYFINEASIGASAAIVHQVNRTSKRLGGKAAFALGALRGLASWRDRRVRIRVDGQEEQTVNITAVAVSNGRYFGGGMKIAPTALLDDGQLDVVVIKGAGALKFIQYSGRLYRGAHLDLPLFSFCRGRAIAIEPVDALPPILVETDGENPGHLPARFTLLPKALNLLAPWSTVEAISR